MPHVSDIEAPALARLREDALIVGALDGLISEVNAAACGLTGYRRTELIGMDARNLVAPEWYDFTANQRRRKVDSVEDVSDYKCVFLNKDGTRIPVRVTSTLLKHDGEVTGIRAQVTDLRNDLAIERRLVESEERFRSAFEGAAIGMAMISPDGCWLRVNDALSRFLGYSKDELLDLTFQDVTHPDDLERDVETKQDMLDGRMSWFHMEKRYLRKDGTVVWGLMAVSLVRDTAGAPAYFISQICDITAEKSAEANRLGALQGLPTPFSGLSQREAEVVNLLAVGERSLDAAHILGISEQTVQTLVKRAMTKLNARNRTHLVAKAIHLGVVASATAQLQAATPSRTSDSETR